MACQLVHCNSCLVGPWEEDLQAGGGEAGLWGAAALLPRQENAVQQL